MQTVAILGASASRQKFGNKAVRAFQRAGWQVYPVNPTGGEIEGMPVYASLAEVPTPVNLVSVYLPTAVTLGLLPAIAAAAPDQLFLNPGADAAEVVDAARVLGLAPERACSIRHLGFSPSEFPD